MIGNKFLLKLKNNPFLIALPTVITTNVSLAKICVIIFHFLLVISIGTRAYQHLNRIQKEARCQWPKPKLFRVGTLVEEHATKTYYPHCTILHRCSNESGCCFMNDKCQPKLKENVTLFFVVNVNSTSKMYFLYLIVIIEIELKS